MSSIRQPRSWNRREVLAAGCLVLGGAIRGSRALASDGKSAPDSQGPYAPFKMGLQSYSLRGLKKDGKSDFGLALEATKNLGLHYWESYVAHVPMNNPDGLADARRALEQAGLIQGYTALIDQHKAGFPVNVFVSITLDRQSQAGLEAFESAVRKVPEVMECYLMTGEHDYLLRLVVTDMADFERVHAQHLTRLPSVARVHSSFAMRTVTRAGGLPLPR